MMHQLIRGSIATHAPIVFCFLLPLSFVLIAIGCLIFCAIFINAMFDYDESKIKKDPVKYNVRNGAFTYEEPEWIKEITKGR